MAARQLAFLLVVAAVLACAFNVAAGGRVLTEGGSLDLPFFVNWPAELPQTVQDEEAAKQKCTTLLCTHVLLDAMRDRFNSLKATCDHRALFSLLYLRVTEGFLAVSEPDTGYWNDQQFLIWYDWVFGRFYLDAFDGYRKGRQVPEAWRIAFDAAVNKQATGTGDLLLGVNAHVNRDLPFVLAGIGLNAPDGTSRKPDHDKVNVVLRAANTPTTMELARRFDPSISDSNVPGTTIDDEIILNALIAWREQAWRNAERLVAAHQGQSLETVAAVTASIEAQATAEAQTILATNSYVSVLGVPVGQTSAQRDAYCALHKDDN